MFQCLTENQYWDLRSVYAQRPFGQRVEQTMFAKFATMYFQVKAAKEDAIGLEAFLPGHEQMEENIEDEIQEVQLGESGQVTVGGASFNLNNLPTI